MKDLTKDIRFEVISNYPRSLFKTGIILKLTNTKNRDGNPVYVYDEDNAQQVVIIDYALESFPKIFRKLKWWEKRENQDLPEYVKFIIKKSTWTGTIFKVIHYKNINDGYLGVGPRDSNTPAKRFLPATEEEYIEFKKLRNETY